MDVQERKVIRWKRELLSSNLTMDDTTIKKLKSWDLIWDSVVKELQESEIKNDEKVWKYLEHLMRAKLERNAFQTLCEFLDEENPWISSELREELVLERGQLKLDEYIKNEASTLVHRHFGGMKRFSEGEKKQFEDLLAARNQCTKNIWMRNLEQTRQALSEQLALSEDRNNVIGDIASKIQTFLNSTATPLCKEYHDQDNLHSSFSSTNFRRVNEGSSPSLLLKLEAATDKIIEFAKCCQLNVEDLQEEKCKTAHLLEGFAGELGVELSLDDDNGIKKWLKRLKVKHDDDLRELIEKEKEIKEIRVKMKEVEENYLLELRERDQNIRFLASSLEKMHLELDANKQERANMEETLNVKTENILELEEKMKCWENFRRYGYWHGRNHEGCVKCHRNSSLDRKLLQMRPRKEVGVKKHVCKSLKKTDKRVPGTDFC